MTSRSATTDWIRRFHPAPEARHRLVCFPHAGGAASYFHSVSTALTPATEVLAVQYPGRQDRRTEPRLHTVAEMAAGAARALRPWTDLPMVLFGHSMGASVAYEVARILTADGPAPSALVVSGRRAPSRYRDERVHLLDDAGVLAEMRRLDGTQAGLLDDEDIRAMVLPTIRSDYQAVETYRHEPGVTLRCPVLALTGDDDPLTTIDEAGDWAKHTAGPFTLRIFPGGHFFLNDHVAAVTALIRERLEEAE